MIERIDFAHVYRFVIRVEDPTLKEAQVQTLLKIATRQASEAARNKRNSLRPKLEMEGGFGGFGETTILLTLLHAVKAGAVAAALGTSSAAGKMFFDKFLAPKLRKLNLLPSRFQRIHSPSRLVSRSKPKKKRRSTE